MMMRLLLGAMSMICGLPPASADEASVCYNYGCARRAVVHFARLDLERVQALFADAQSPREEREAIAHAMAWMYFVAGEQSPIWRDHGGNLDDDDTADGRMDCIDHATNTTTWLELLARHGWLRYHAVGASVRRGWLLSVHWTARIAETTSREEYAVDTWFLDPGLPATIYPLQEWRSGARPRGTEIVRWH